MGNKAVTVCVGTQTEAVQDGQHKPHLPPEILRKISTYGISSKNFVLACGKTANLAVPIQSVVCHAHFNYVYYSTDSYEQRIDTVRINHAYRHQLPQIFQHMDVSYAVKIDITACVLQAEDFSIFLSTLSQGSAKLETLKFTTCNDLAVFEEFIRYFNVTKFPRLQEIVWVVNDSKYYSNIQFKGCHQRMAEWISTAFEVVPTSSHIKWRLIGFFPDDLISYIAALPQTHQIYILQKDLTLTRNIETFLFEYSVLCYEKYKLGLLHRMKERQVDMTSTKEVLNYLRYSSS